MYYYSTAPLHNESLKLLVMSPELVIPTILDTADYQISYQWQKKNIQE